MSIKLLPDYTIFMIMTNADNSIHSGFIHPNLIELLQLTFGTQSYYTLRCYNGNLYAVVNDKDIYLITL